MKTEELDATGKPYKIYTNLLEDKALQQFTDAMRHEQVVKGALMPDAHMGYTLPIGAVVATIHALSSSLCNYLHYLLNVVLLRHRLIQIL